MIRILGYNWLKVGKKLNLYPNYVLEWVLSEMLAVPQKEQKIKKAETVV